MMERSAGILLPVFSLQSDYGIGNLGKGAREWIDFLKAAGQRWWQILPVGLASGGNSPYTSESTFAGNPYYVDPEQLAEQGLLTKAELAEAKLPKGGRIDYSALQEKRESLLRLAFSRWDRKAGAAELEKFRREHPWVRAFALYRAVKAENGNRPWYLWQDWELRGYTPQALWAAERRLEEDILFHTFVQLQFFRQWEALRKYANAAGIGILGDMPIYVSLDSADVWSERKEFLLDADGHPSHVAGVPPDYFSEDGQLWGNPLYNWPAMKEDGYGWWIRRVEGASKLFDALRIDHFRGLESYWSIPADATSAKIGTWEKGPGIGLVRVLTQWFHTTSFIAEDLGILTDEVHQLRNEAGLPGMKVLEFAFSSGASNAYLPHNHTKNCVCYTGTHDNDTILGWINAADEKEKAFVKAYLGTDEPEQVRRALLRMGQGSVAQLFVAQLQDYLALGTEHRINIPGVAEGNWGWRMPEDCLTEELAAEVRELTRTFERCS